jgi:hypothetical protein
MALKHLQWRKRVALKVETCPENCSLAYYMSLAMLGLIPSSTLLPRLQTANVVAIKNLKS